MREARRALTSAPVISFSQREITIVATPLPTRLVKARHSLMNLSMPSTSVIAATGTGLSGIAARVAARVMNPAPVTPDAPLLVSIATSRIVTYCPRLRSTPTAWARNSVVRVM